MDHPRSRGVYNLGGSISPTDMGSSPLARGLLPHGHGGFPRGRIIPARAGFTHRSGLPLWVGQDHPRSRGVYPEFVANIDVEAGSSPLARGLHAPTRGHGAGAGIIPARAGFTASRMACVTHSKDHPRSRGVYDFAAWISATVPGSSPLARGLPSAIMISASGSGIIPARAGFTREHGTRNGRVADHPRSRGVYPSRIIQIPQEYGSSPLARGLPAVALGGAEESGIIPARAGFTRLGRRRRITIEDHPRSRGVYTSR